MKNVTLTVRYADSDGFPAGSAVVRILASLDTVPPSNPSAPLVQTMDPGTLSCTFVNVPDGVWQFSVAAQDSNAATLGTAVGGSFTVADDPVTVTLSLPSGVTVSFS